MNPVTFTLDVEDHVPAHHDPRAPVVTRTILEFCERRDIRGTFFVVGELAAEHPDLVRDIAAAVIEPGWTIIGVVDLVATVAIGIIVDRRAVRRRKGE